MEKYSSMRTPRVVVSSDEVHGDHVVFSKRNSHYLRTVLRLKPGDATRAQYGDITYLVEVEGFIRGCVVGRITKEARVAETRTQHIGLAFSCIRPAPTEEIFRHCSELGVNAFFPIIAERSNRRPPFIRERWQRVVESAVSQCGRKTIPTINDPLPFGDFLRAIPDDSTRLVLSVEEDTVSLLSALQRHPPKRVLILVGPEGGFTQVEMSHALGIGFQAVSLGRYVLRTETAAMLAVGMVSSWHDWKAMGVTRAFSD